MRLMLLQITECSCRLAPEQVWVNILSHDGSTNTLYTQSVQGLILALPCR